MTNREIVVLRDERAKVVTIGPEDIVCRYLKHHCPDGDYSLEGPDIDLTLTRKDGIVYPTSGMGLPPRSTTEAQQVFEGRI